MNENLFLNPTFLGIIISAIIAVTSWFIIAWLNRRIEIFKEKLDLRIKTLNEIKNIFYKIENTPYWETIKKEELIKIGNELMICGRQKEIKSWILFFNKYNEYIKQSNDKTHSEKAELVKKLNDIFYKTWLELINNLRKEIKVEKSIKIEQFKSIIDSPYLK